KGKALTIGEPVVRVGDGVTNKVIGAAMEAVAPRARDHVENGSPGKAVLRTEIRLLYLELFHRFRRGNVHGLRHTAVGFEVGGRSAVHQNVGTGPAAAVGNEVRLAAIVALVVHVGDAGREIGQLSHITANQRQIIDEPAVD